MSIRRKAMLLYLAISLAIVPNNVVKAADMAEINQESEKQMYERVCSEVLSGEITDDEDVIKVALAQYRERVNARKRLPLSEQSEKVDDSLSITQLVDRYVDENGHVMEDIVTTDLAVLDGNNNLVRASTIENGSGQIADYSIYFTMNVSVTVDTSVNKVRFNWFDTTLIYGTAIKAGSLTQDSKYSPEPFFEYADVTKTINSPSANVAYRYTPNNKDMVSFGNFACGRSCRSIVKAGSKSFTLVYAYTNNDRGWLTQ